MSDEELIEQIMAGDPEGVDRLWRLVWRVLAITDERLDGRKLSMSGMFCLIRDFDEAESRPGDFADWCEDRREENPEDAAEFDQLRQRLFAKLQAMTLDGSLLDWCRRHKVNPVAVADFAFGGRRTRN